MDVELPRHLGHTHNWFPLAPLALSYDRVAIEVLYQPPSLVILPELLKSGVIVEGSGVLSALFPRCAVGGFLAAPLVDEAVV